MNHLSELLEYFSIYIIRLIFAYITFLLYLLNLWAVALFSFSVVIPHFYGARAP